jgi:hypothetical protein
MTSKWRDAIPRETGAKLTKPGEEDAFRGNWNARINHPETRPPQYLPTSARKKPTMVEIAKQRKPANMDDRIEYLTKQVIRDNVSDDAIKPNYANTEMMSASMPDFDQMLRDQQTVVRGQGRSMNMEKINKSVEPMNFALLNDPVEIPKEEEKIDERPEMMSAAMDLKPIDDFREEQRKKVMDQGHIRMKIQPAKLTEKHMMSSTPSIPYQSNQDTMLSADLSDVKFPSKFEQDVYKRSNELKPVAQRAMLRRATKPVELPTVTTTDIQQPAQATQSTNEHVEDDDDEESANQTVVAPATTQPTKSGNRFFSRPKLPNLFGSSKPKQQPPQQNNDVKQQQPTEAIKKPSSRPANGSSALRGAKRLYQGIKKADEKIENKMKSLGTDLYGEEDTDTPAIRASLCLFNCMFMVMMFAFILTSFFLMGSYPVLVPDTFNTVALSASLLWLRLWWLKGSVITLMVMGAAVWSFAVNMFTFQLMHPVSYTMVTSDTLVLTPTLNRTVLNFTHVVDVSPSWWDAATWLHVVAMINETVTVMFLFLMSICQLNQARVSAARRRRQRRLGVAGEVVEQEVICIKVVGKCTRCEYCTCSNWICCRTRGKVTDSQWSDSLVTMMRVVAGAIWGLLLSSLAISMASALEHVPAWTTLESPHFFLVIGLVCWCTPPIGETYWYAPRQTQPTVVWAPRFVVGGIALAFGLALSTWTLVMERQRVEWTTGAVWLNRDSYTAKLNGASNVELYGGYTYSTTSALDKIKLRDYALGHHIIELLLVILTWVLWVMGTMVFLLDSSAILPDPSITGGLMEDDVDVEQQANDCQCGDSDCDDSEVKVRVSVTT